MLISQPLTDENGDEHIIAGRKDKRFIYFLSKHTDAQRARREGNKLIVILY